jgi:hypothetical protein
MKIWKLDGIDGLDKLFEVVRNSFFVINVWTVDILATKSCKSAEEGTVKARALGDGIIADHVG